MYKRQDWNNLPLNEAVFPMLYVVICTTFMTYFLNGYALTRLTSSEVAVFVYLQPIIGVAFALFSKSDRLSLTIIIASILIFTYFGWMIDREIDSSPFAILIGMLLGMIITLI